MIEYMAVDDRLGVVYSLCFLLNLHFWVEEQVGTFLIEEYVVVADGLWVACPPCGLLNLRFWVEQLIESVVVDDRFWVS